MTCGCCCTFSSHLPNSCFKLPVEASELDQAKNNLPKHSGKHAQSCSQVSTCLLDSKISAEVLGVEANVGSSACGTQAAHTFMLLMAPQLWHSSAQSSWRLKRQSPDLELTRPLCMYIYIYYIYIYICMYTYLFIYLFI